MLAGLDAGAQHAPRVISHNRHLLKSGALLLLGAQEKNEGAENLPCPLKGRRMGRTAEGNADVVGWP